MSSPTVQIESVLQLGMGWLPEQTGGLNRVYHGLFSSLQRRGVDVKGLVAADSVDGEQAVRAFARRGSSLIGRMLAARRAIRCELRRKPQVVASHFALYTAAAVQQLRDYPFVVHFHGPWADEKRREGDRGLSYAVKKRLESHVYSRARYVITLSESFARIANEEYGVPRSKLRVIPGGVDTGAFRCGIDRPEARVKLGWPSDRPIAFCIRRLVPRMGVDRLINATTLAIEQVPDLLVLIGGKGPIRNQLQSQIESRGLDEHVRLLGFVPDDDLPLAYRAADFTVVPTETLEGFGLIVAESLAAGTPVLVTPVGGLPEVVSGLDPGLVMDATNPEAIAAGLVNAARQNNRLPDSAMCQAYARDQFDWHVATDRILEVYSDAVSGR